MKSKIKAWIIKWLSEDDKFSPKFSRELRACSFESKDPTGKGDYHTYLFSCTEWNNGEGFLFDLGWYYKDKSVEKHISISHNEIEGILACLNHMKYFDE